MRLDLRDIIHVPDGKKTFQFQLDLSGQNFYGSKPIVHPIQAEGSVTNHAGALVLEGTARSRPASAWCTAGLAMPSHYLTISPPSLSINFVDKFVKSI